jgi:UDP-N-acetylmuramate--alanine ligase
MYNQNIKLHFIGIGGVGMAGIAEVLLNLGYSVSGSDIQKGALTEHLCEFGAKIRIGHDKRNITQDINVVVYSSAISQDNPELVMAKELGIPVIARAEMLAELMRMKYGVVVAGSHGKTTTTSMIAKIMRDGGLDPTVIVGGRLLNQESGANVGSGQYLVAESDESDGSFCLLRPAIAVVTNIDREHLQFYGSFGALEESFTEFMTSVPFYGLVVACIDDPVVARISKTLQRRVVTYGLTPQADIYAKDLKFSQGKSSFALVVHNEELGRVNIALPGSHMISNALAAIAVGLELGIYAEEAATALETFAGVARRSELVGEVNGIKVFDDYAHHPTEIAATLRAIKSGYLAENDSGRLYAIFQPHRFSRTRDLFSDFLGAFSEADKLTVVEIYRASEEEIPGVSGELLCDAIFHADKSYINDLKEVPALLVDELLPGDVVITLGAGSVGSAGRELLRLLEIKNQS